MHLPAKAKRSDTAINLQMNVTKSRWHWLVPVFVVALVSSTLSVAAFVPSPVAAQAGAAALAPPDLQTGDDTGVSSTDDLIAKQNARFNVPCPSNRTEARLFSDNPVPGTLVGVHFCTGLGQAITAVRAMSRASLLTPRLLTASRRASTT